MINRQASLEESAGPREAPGAGRDPSFWWGFSFEEERATRLPGAWRVVYGVVALCIHWLNSDRTVALSATDSAASSIRSDVAMP